MHMDQSIFRRSNVLDDWYRFDPCPGGIPEGSSDEWREVVEAMQQGLQASFKRVAATRLGDEYWITSPHNMTGPKDGINVPVSQVEVFAERVLVVLDHEPCFDKGCLICHP